MRILKENPACATHLVFREPAMRESKSANFIAKVFTRTVIPRELELTGRQPPAPSGQVGKTASRWATIVRMTECCARDPGAPRFTKQELL